MILHEPLYYLNRLLINKKRKKKIEFTNLKQYRSSIAEVYGKKGLSQFHPSYQNKVISLQQSDHTLTRLKSYINNI